MASFNETTKKEKEPQKGFGKLAYKLTLARWFFNFGWVWVVGFILTWINTITVVYYLIPAVKESMTFGTFAIYGSVILILLSTFLGWLLIKVFKVQSIETKLGTDVNPYSHTWLTQKEIDMWRLFLSMAEQIKELSEKQEIISEDKKKIFEKRMKKVLEYLTDSRKHELDILKNHEAIKDIEN